MSPIQVGPSAVAPPHVRRLTDDEQQVTAPVQRVAVAGVPAAVVVPRQVEPADPRVQELQREVEALRAELDDLRAG